MEATSTLAEVGLRDIPGACVYLSIGRTKLLELIQGKELRMVRIGRAVRVTETSLRDYVRRLEAEQTQ
jgi:excisionase family DNA binding protein